MSDPTIQQGSQGESVKYLQEALKRFSDAHGSAYDPGLVDGIFGPKTEAAVRAIQEYYGVQVDGITGPITWAAIQSYRS